MVEIHSDKKLVFFRRPFFPEIIALIGLILYTVQAIIFSRIRMPNLDEGSYLLKGLLFAKGGYVPFQPYGFWVNKMYLSFMIWGWVQELFGAGLLAPRIFAVIFSVLSVAGTWIVARRLSNRWLAALAVWALALNPSLISTYSLANSQVLIIAMLVWTLVLVLGPDRPLWQLVLGAALSGVMVLTRENMVFVLPLLIIYILWEHGKRQSLFALASMVLVLAIGHLVYWPAIMQLWIKWLPFKSFFGLQRLNASGGTTGQTQGLLATRLDSLALAMRENFFPFIGSLFVLLLWPRKTDWRSASHLRAAVFLAVTFIVLLVSHAWASIGDNSCIYCFTNYFAFWGTMGLLLVITTLGALEKTPSLLSRIAIIGGLVMVCSAIFYSWSEQIGGWLLNLPLPRIQTGHFLDGWTTLWHVLNNKYHLVYAIARQYVPPVVGVLVGIVVVLILYLIFRKFWKKNGISFGYFAAVVFLGIGLFLSPLMSWPVSDPLCGKDVVASFQQIGRQVAASIPAGSKVYLGGTITAIPLLYADNYVLFPPQVNGSYSHSLGTDTDNLVKNGYWNDAIDQTWRQSANVFILSDNRVNSLEGFFSPEQYDLLQFPPGEFLCQVPDYIDLYVKKP
jgi:hypothetical protein